jgi:hypothetical protein
MHIFTHNDGWARPLLGTKSARAGSANRVAAGAVGFREDEAPLFSRLKRQRRIDEACPERQQRTGSQKGRESHSFAPRCA